MADVSLECLVCGLTEGDLERLRSGGIIQKNMGKHIPALKGYGLILVRADDPDEPWESIQRKIEAARPTTVERKIYS